MNNLSWVIGLADYLNLEWHGCPGISLWSQTVFTCAKKVYYIGSEGPNIHICFGKIQHLVFLSQMTELKSVDYLQIFLSPPKLFIFLYLLAFLSCPVTLYTSMNSAHSVFHVCSSIRSFPSSVRPSHSAR